MMEKVKYYPVNWSDGMKVNKTIFIQQDDAVTYQLTQQFGALLTDFNYGLLPGDGKSLPGVKMYLHIDNNQQINLRLLQCRLITRGGYYVEFSETDSSVEQRLTSPIAEVSFALNELQKDASLLVIVSVNPYRRIPFGLADMEETPPRLPHSRPTFELHVMPVQHASVNTIGTNSIPIGHLKMSGDRVVLDDEYIPPCAFINSHYDLIEIHAMVEQFYSRMENHSLQIIQKIILKKQNNEMADIVRKLCENLVIVLSNGISETKSLSYHQAPVNLICRINSMAQLFKNTLDFYSGCGKEEFINYCEDWCDTSRGALENAINSLNNDVYNHLNIKKSTDKITDFIKITSNLFHHLSGLDYIGKRRDAGIFLKEKSVTNDFEDTRKKRIYLTD